MKIGICRIYGGNVQMSRDVFDRIDNIMKRKRKKNIDLINYLGLTRTTYDNWRRGKSESYMDHIDKISDFLNVNPNYLLTGNEKYEEQIHTINNSKEEKLLKLFRSISDKEADILLNIASAFVDSIKNASVQLG